MDHKGFFYFKKKTLIFVSLPAAITGGEHAQHGSVLHGPGLGPRAGPARSPWAGPGQVSIIFCGPGRVRA